MTALFVLFWQWNNHWRWRPVCRRRRLRENVSTFLGKSASQRKILATPLTPGDLTWGFSDLEMTWLPYGAGAAIVYHKFEEVYAAGHTGCSYTEGPTECVDASLSLAVTQGHKHLTQSYFNTHKCLLVYLTKSHTTISFIRHVRAVDIAIALLFSSDTISSTWTVKLSRGTAIYANTKKWQSHCKDITLYLCNSS